MRRFIAASCACSEHGRSSACALSRYNDYFKQPTRRRIQSTFLGKCAQPPCDDDGRPLRRHENDLSNYFCLVFFYSLFVFITYYFCICIVEKNNTIMYNNVLILYDTLLDQLYTLSKFLQQQFLTISLQFKQKYISCIYMWKSESKVGQFVYYLREN